MATGVSAIAIHRMTKVGQAAVAVTPPAVAADEVEVREPQWGETRGTFPEPEDQTRPAMLGNLQWRARLERQLLEQPVWLFRGVLPA